MLWITLAIIISIILIVRNEKKNTYNEDNMPGMR